MSQYFVSFLIVQHFPIHNSKVAVIFCVVHAVTMVSFEELTYSIDEDAGAVQLVLILSDSLSTDITIVVITTDGSANGELYELIIL